MDTASDFRILLTEKGISELEKLITNFKIQNRKGLINDLKKMKSNLQIVKYSYMSPADLKQLTEFKEIIERSQDIVSIILKTKTDGDHKFKNAIYWLEYIGKLPELIDRGEIRKAYESIRFFSGEIKNRRVLEKLWHCSVDCNFRIDVVTNSPKFKPGMNVVVSYLPPVSLGGVVSEGMFVDASLDFKGELNLEQIREISGALGEVESMVLKLLK